MAVSVNGFDYFNRNEVIPVGNGTLGTTGFDYFNRNEIFPAGLPTSSGSNTATGSGGLFIGGTSIVQPTYFYNASGLLTLGGTDTVKPTYPYNASGLLTLGGTSTTKPVYPNTGSGGLFIGGGSSFVPTYLYNASGLLTLGGTVTVTSSGGGGSATGSGGLFIGGSSTVKPTYLYNASGGLVVNGASQLAFTYVASGLLSVGGSSDVVTAYSHNASGLLNITGRAFAGASYQIGQASGIVYLGGSANSQLIFTYNASGGLVTSNAANAKLSFAFVPSGGLVFSGTWDITGFSVQHVASGKLKLGSTGLNWTGIIRYVAIPRRMRIVRSKTQASMTVAPWQYNASGGLFFNGAAPTTWTGPGANLNFGNSAQPDFVVYIVGPDPGVLNLGGSAGVTSSYWSYNGSGKLNVSNDNSQVARYYPASGGLVTGSAADVKFLMTYNSSGGLSFGGKTIASFKLDITKTFSWSISQGILRTYRVEGKCGSAARSCPPISNPDTASCTGRMQLVANIQAHSLADLGNKITARGGFGAINKIQMWSLPVNKSDWSSTDKISCNVLGDPLAFRDLPEFANYTFDTTLTSGAKVGSAIEMVYGVQTYVADGGINCGGVATNIAGPNWSYVSTGNLTVYGSALVNCNVYKSYLASGLLSPGGTTTASCTFKGDFSTGAKFGAFLSNISINYGTVAAPVLAPSSTQVQASCCDTLSLPQILYIKHDLSRSDVLSNFLKVNGFTLPPTLKMTYSRQKNSWYTNAHYIGNSVTNSDQILNLIFEFGCTSGNSVNLFASTTDTVWGFSLLVTSKNLSDLKVGVGITRLFIEFDPADVCGISGDLKFDFSYNLNTEETAPTVRQVAFSDHLGVFNSSSYLSNPNVSFEVAVNPPTIGAGLFDQSKPFNKILLGV
jgi:hypothetical protein